MIFFASVSPKADSLGVPWFTDSMLDAILVVAAIVIFVQIVTRKVTLIPSGAQNFLEWVIESLHGTLEGIVGRHMIRRTFPLLCSYFIFILTANWSGLLPGVGSIGWGHVVNGAFEVETPLLRPANADLNMTMALTLLFMGLWLYWSIQETGFIGFIVHLFGPKGLLKGDFMGVVKVLVDIFNAVLFVIFIGVGVIEVVSIASRGLSLPLRLYGNIYAGSNLVHAMRDMGGPWLGILVAMPFYFLEVLIGFLQAMVFMLLCAVYIKLSTTHAEGEPAH